MAFCSKCGANVPDEVKFCNACGTEMIMNGDSSQQVSQQGFEQQQDSSNQQAYTQQDFSGQQGNPGQQGFSGQQSNPGQQDFSGQQSNPGQQNYSGQQANPGQQNYSGQQTNPGQQNYSGQQTNPGQQNYSGQQGSFNSQNSFNNAMNFVNNTQDSTGQYDPNDIAQNKGISAVAYLPFLFFVPLLAKPESKFARFHANQGLCFTIVAVILNICRSILEIIFNGIFRSEAVKYGIHLGYRTPNGIAILLCTILSLAVSVTVLILFIIGLMNAINGKAKELPLIGKFNLIK